MVRYTLAKDGDGHEYVLPVDMLEEFERWSEEIELYDFYDDAELPDFTRYDKYRFGGGTLTFIDPDFE